ncbi:MAG: LysR family transcriptional regulator [Bacteroidia bacterium]|nr:LysR family transcriptional regulator [Bacteroidia bacterium]
MNYTLHQLRVFLKVAELKSVTKASEELHLTQPAVSIQLKSFQKQFEIPLTEVIGRQLYITDFGKTIAEVSKRILEEAEVLKTTVDNYNGLITGKIKISVVSTGKYVIPYFLQGFMEKYPGVEIIIDVSNKSRVVESLVNNESDFSLVSVIPANIPIKRVELMDNILYLVGSTKFENMNIKLKNLKDLTLIFRENGSATRMAMENFLSQHNISGFKSMVLVSNEAVKQAVNAGIGFSIMPIIGLRNELALGSMKVFPIKGLPVITQWNLIYNRDKKLTPATTELLNFIQETKQRVVDEYFELGKYYDIS